MDHISTIQPYKDGSFAMILEAQRRGLEVFHVEQKTVRYQNGIVCAEVQSLQVEDNTTSWFKLGEPRTMSLFDVEAILMRKDPPFDMEYIYTTYLLDQCESHGVVVVNKPQSIRDYNEKMSIMYFPECIPPTVITRDMTQLRAFLAEQQEIVVKPLDVMAGTSVFHVDQKDMNASVILETISHLGTRTVMAQKFIPEVRKAGDRRVILVDGEVIPYVLSRVPAPHDFRGNLAAGAQAEGQPINEREKWIAAQLGPELKKRGLIFVGIDVLGDYLTEINVTSPTGLRPIDRKYNTNISAKIFEAIEQRLR